MKVLAKTLWFFLFFTLTVGKFSVCIGKCRENEQRALDTLKKEVYDPDDFLSSWIVGEDCCEWEGVVCHNLTGNVLKLNILNYGGYLRISNLDWLPNLVNLEFLQMDTVDLSRATNWLQVINMLPSLVDLYLTRCGLHHIQPLLDHRNFSSLETLYLSGNNFTSSVPTWIFSLPTLVFLDLSENNFVGPFLKGSINLTSLAEFKAFDNPFNCLLPRWLSDLHNLEILELYNCGIEGVIPSEIGNNTKLQALDLSFNNLIGTLPESFGHLSMLEYFSISNNRLEGVVTESHFTSLTQLKTFEASENKLTLKVSQNWIPPFQAQIIRMGGWNLGPRFPMWLQTQKDISVLDISNGGIEGRVPTWFWNLTSPVQLLNLSHNQFIGELPKISVSWPGFLYLASNNFSGPLPQIPTEVTKLDLSNNSFSAALSHFLCEPKYEYYETKFLNLRGNDLSGEIPDCWMNWPELIVLILRDNNLSGGLPRSMEVLSELESLDFRRNRLTGLLPSSLRNCKKLQKIDLAENELVGPLPPWLGLRLSKLIIISLRSNKFSGELPPALCHLKDLQILDLANNSFFGIIPRCIGNFKGMITARPFHELTYKDNMSTLVRESAVITTKGHIYQYDTILALVTSMDMSNNNLSGDIPTSLTHLVGLRFCNLSKNHLTGRIPNGIGYMKVLESVDLSENQLSGHIPQSLSSLTSLAYLDISYNNLSGVIPRSTQLQSFSPLSFQGNKLCGLPLIVNCSSGGQLPSLENENDDTDENELDWFYTSMAIGFALSFWGVVASLIFKRSWRHSYYRFLDGSWSFVRAKLHI